MRRSFEEGHCTFCKLNRELNVVLFEDNNVLAWEIPQQFKRPEIKMQFLVVPKRHVRMPWELTQDETLSVLAAKKFLARTFNLVGGMIFARFGDMRFNAGTVPHLHYNVWVPAQTDEVRVPIFKVEIDREANQKRSESFSARYESGEQA